MAGEAGRILLISNREDTKNAVARAFEPFADSFRLFTARSGEELAQFALREAPDLILADWELPDRSEILTGLGEEVAPVVMIISPDDAAAYELARAAGALECVERSSEGFRSLPETVRRLLRIGSRAAQRRESEKKPRAEDPGRSSPAPLTESAALLNGLFESAPELVSVHDRDLRIVLSNWKGGVSPPADAHDERPHCYEAYMGRSSACEECPALKVFETGKAHAAHQLNPEEGRVWEAHAFPILDEEGRVTLVAEHIRDVTARKRAQEALRESEERFRAVFESVQECIFIKDTSLRYTHVNPAVTNLLGVSESHIIGKRAEDLFGEDVGRQVSERSLRVLAGETVECEQTRVVRGVSMTFYDTAAPLRNKEDEIVGLCLVSRYVTERELAAEKQRQRSRRYPSEAMRDTLKKAAAAASTGGIVLLLGESGSGKDFLARWIHDHSERAGGPFLSINCAALPRELAESELFGHERGAFTGAAVRRKGLLESAEGGTILLNEIGELEISIQSKLLAFLDTSSFMRVGGRSTLNVDTRLIAATHRDLLAEVAHKGFLEPLFYRLNVFPIEVPPLRARRDDIPMLVEEILASLAKEMQPGKLPTIDEGALLRLRRYSWPGNVRELRNVIERSLMLWTDGPFTIVLPEPAAEPREWSCSVSFPPGKTLREAHSEVTRSLCLEALRRCGGNKTEAARSLGVSRDAFYRYLKKFTAPS